MGPGVAGARGVDVDASLGQDTHEGDVVTVAGGEGDEEVGAERADELTFSEAEVACTVGGEADK